MLSSNKADIALPNDLKVCVDFSPLKPGFELDEFGEESILPNERSLSRLFEGAGTIVSAARPILRTPTQRTTI